MAHIEAESCASHMTVPVRVHHCNSVEKKWNADLQLFTSDGQEISGCQLKNALLASAGIPEVMRNCSDTCKVYLCMDNDENYKLELPNTSLKESHIVQMANRNCYILLTDGVIFVSTVTKSTTDGLLTGPQSFNVRVN